MSISAGEVRHVAELARMALSDHEVEELSAQLSRILDHMETLRELPTDDVEPTAHVLPIRNVWRQDTVGESLPPDAALANAPERRGNYFLVPKIVER